MVERRRQEDDDRNIAQRWIAPDDLQGLAPVHLGQGEVEQYQAEARGTARFAAVLLALVEIVEQLLAPFDKAHGIHNVRVFLYLLRERAIVLILAPSGPALVLATMDLYRGEAQRYCMHRCNDFRDDRSVRFDCALQLRGEGTTADTCPTA